NENAVATPADDPQPSGADGVAENAIDDGAKAISCTTADGENGRPGVKCDMDTAAGKFKVGGLDAGTYWLHETTAPDGYTINKTLYQFTIDANGSVTWNGGWASGEATGAIDEKLKPGDNNAISDTPTEATWNKVDTKGGKLAGSQWKIVGPSPATDVYCVADNVTVDANGATTPAGIEFTGCTGKKLSDAANTADEAGVITVRGLPVGTYTLTETKAPDGYVATPTVYTLTISDTEASTVVAQTAADRPTTRSGGNREAAANVPNASAPVNIQIPVKKSVKYTSWPKDSNGNYVNFNFKIEATKSTVDANPAAPMPAECSSSDATKNDCTISLAPKSDADDLSNVIAKFGKMTFTDANLAAASGDASDYAKTYTYKITEIVPDSADAVENLRYSKAEYQVVVTVKQAKDSSGKLSGLSVSATMTRIKDDSGNAEAGGGKVIGTWSSTSTGSSAGTAVEATFVNTKVLTGLPATGADWTGRLVLLVGDGFILVGVLIAGGYQLAKRRREEDSD
ncbi:prealbumin-like fold domain-containing protein, partial [Bifidobacterium breve]|uniref:prealbumin-like fold domain-containing protein n=1 Tax=Bifidobacterium breve TaxID=1685 RepID=UPI000E3A8888